MRKNSITNMEWISRTRKVKKAKYKRIAMVCYPVVRKKEIICMSAHLCKKRNTRRINRKLRLCLLHSSHSGLPVLPQTHQARSHPRAFAPALPSAWSALPLDWLTPLLLPVPAQTSPSQRGLPWPPYPTGKGLPCHDTQSPSHVLGSPEANPEMECKV